MKKLRKLLIVSTVLTAFVSCTKDMAPEEQQTDRLICIRPSIRLKQNVTKSEMSADRLLTLSARLTDTQEEYFRDIPMINSLGLWSCGKYWPVEESLDLYSLGDDDLRMGITSFDGTGITWSLPDNSAMQADVLYGNVSGAECCESVPMNYKHAFALLKFTAQSTVPFDEELEQGIEITGITVSDVSWTGSFTVRNNGTAITVLDGNTVKDTAAPMEDNYYVPGTYDIDGIGPGLMVPAQAQTSITVEFNYCDGITTEHMSQTYNLDPSQIWESGKSYLYKFNFDHSALYVEAEEMIDHTTAGRYLTFHSETANALTLKKYNNDLPFPEYQYSIDGGTTWTDASAGTKVSFGEGTDLLLRGHSTSKLNTRFVFTDNSETAEVSCTGNIMHLLRYDEDVTSLAPFGSEVFSALFENQTCLTTGPDLPATTLTATCYLDLFKGCTKLTKAPELPAMRLYRGCYKSMFQGCTSLTEMPELPAKKMVTQAYRNMFNGCSSLVTAHELPATEIGEDCYSDMFYGCTSLTTAPKFDVTNAPRNCCLEMFYNCTSLSDASGISITAVELGNSCFKDMFHECTSLTKAPAVCPEKVDVASCYQMFYRCINLTDISGINLAATVLSQDSFRAMFDKCYKITKAPPMAPTTLAPDCCRSMSYECKALTDISDVRLPATTLAVDCYYFMFCECHSLTEAPVLPATTLVTNCYYSMFKNCKKLRYIKAMFTTTPSNSYTPNWVNGVPSTGTFVKNAEATWNVTGNNGVPKGWTVTTE